MRFIYRAGHLRDGHILILDESYVLVERPWDGVDIVL
jgi:hypothetical protein